MNWTTYLQVLWTELDWISCSSCLSILKCESCLCLKKQHETWNKKVLEPTNSEMNTKVSNINCYYSQILMHWLHVRPNSNLPPIRHFICWFLAVFHPKFTSKIQKKRFLSPQFFWKLCQMSGKQSEDLPNPIFQNPKVCRKGQKRRKKSESLPKGTKKAKKNPKVCRIPILLLNFAEKNLQKICL